MWVLGLCNKNEDACEKITTTVITSILVVLGCATSTKPYAGMLIIADILTFATVRARYHSKH